MDEQFRVNPSRRKPRDNRPPVRITAEAYARLLVIQHDTGLSFAAIIDQIMEYAISRSERWGYLAREFTYEDDSVTVPIEGVLEQPEEAEEEPEPPKCPYFGKGRRR